MRKQLENASKYCILDTKRVPLPFPYIAVACARSAAGWYWL